MLLSIQKCVYLQGGQDESHQVQEKHSTLQFHVPQNTFYLLSSSQVFQWTQYRTSMNHLVNSTTCCQPSTVTITVLLGVSVVIQTASVFFHHRFSFLKSKKKVSSQTHSGDSANYTAWLDLSIIFWVRKEGMSLWICLDWVMLWLLWASVFVSWAWA